MVKLKGLKLRGRSAESGPWTKFNNFLQGQVMLLSVVIGIHIFVALFLIIAILLHAGRGGGLSSAFGGGLPSTFSGSTLMERNLDRLTITLAIVFGITSTILAILYK